MNKFFGILAGLMLLPLSVQAADFKEGTHYEVVKQTATAKPEVMEFFSFYCGHCFKFEPIMEKLKANLDKDVTIKKNHVNFLGKEMGVLLTKAFVAAELLGVEETFAEIVFNQLQVQRKNINGEENILTIFKQTGISNEEAKAALESFSVVGSASQMKRNTEKFNVRAVPSVIVNGKYHITTGSVKNADELVELVDFLTKKKD